jgi:hypothetical protein
LLPTDTPAAGSVSHLPAVSQLCSQRHESSLAANRPRYNPHRNKLDPVLFRRRLALILLRLVLFFPSPCPYFFFHVLLWKNHCKMDLKEISYKDVDWIQRIGYDPTERFLNEINIALSLNFGKLRDQ